MDTDTTSESESLINRNLSMNIRSINFELSKLFQRYSVALNKINGGGLLGRQQTRKIQDLDGVAVEYDKGKIVFKHDIDRLQFLLDHKNEVAEAIGTTAQEIYSNRRDLSKVSEYIARMNGKWDLGIQSYNMQMYISKYDGNVGSLDSQQDWVDYILTQTWIDNLAKKAIDESEPTEEDTFLQDHRIEYLANIIQGLVADHEIDYHKSLEEFDPNEYMDSGRNSRYQDAINRLHSFGKLEYAFYELFKPIGGTEQKYIKVRLSTSGELDISGVIGLSDCEHVPWEYGSKEYLRALNTGNQKYLFKLSRPFNDLTEDNPLGSNLWWKPDEKEQLEVEEDEEGEISEPTGYRYFKTYETERFLRWFGTNYVPVLDINTITKKTICSAQRISNDVESTNFYSDATNITKMNADLTRVNIDEATSISLLSMAPKSTIDVINKEDGQYLQLIVSGHQQTSNIAFHITGQMFNSIQEIHHYIKTWERIRDSYRWIRIEKLFLEITRVLNPTVDEVWEKMNKGDNFIPSDWLQLEEYLKPLQTPNIIDLLRFRQIDIETINERIQAHKDERMEFLLGISGLLTNDDGVKISKEDYVDGCDADSYDKHDILLTIQDKLYYCAQLDNYIHRYKDETAPLADWFVTIPMGEETKTTLITDTLDDIYEQNPIDQEILDSFDNITVDILRERIETYNNLIVRLPTNSYHNKLASRHIFMDWKEFIDRSLAKLVEAGDLYFTTGNRGWGSDTKLEDGPYIYREYYTDPEYHTPLVDYSYLFNEDGSYILGENGKPLHDRWDYWSEDDFK